MADNRFGENFPGVPCTGSAQLINFTMSSGTSFVFKNGSATESASLTMFDPNSGNLSTTSVGPSQTKIGK